MRIWPVIRAVLISIVLLGQWIDALPLPELRKKDLQYPVAQDEIQRWTGVLNSLGMELTEEEVVAGALEVGRIAIKFRQITMAPIRPLKRVTGTGQSWGLFAYPDPYAGRLVVEVRQGKGEWVRRFSAPGVLAGERLSQQLRYRRVRGIYDDLGDRPKPSTMYNRFADWVAWQVFTDSPEITAVQIRLDLMYIVPPGEGEAPEDKRRHARMRLRDALTERLSKRWSGE